MAECPLLAALSRHSDRASQCPNRGKSGHRSRGAECPLVTQSGHSTAFEGAILKRRPQFECGHTERDVNRNRAFQRDWLQRERACRAADQDVGADAEAEADVARGADILTGERTGRYTN